MGTTICPNISTKNKYWINKHRYYELKHFCLQYSYWKKEYIELDDILVPTATLEVIAASDSHSDLTSKYAIKKLYYSNNIKMVEESAKKSDEFLYMYILKAVTEGLSYTYLKTKLNIPCGKDLYYDRYRKFFWLLNNERG